MYWKLEERNMKILDNLKDIWECDPVETNFFYKKFTFISTRFSRTKYQWCYRWLYCLLLVSFRSQTKVICLTIANFILSIAKITDIRHFYLIAFFLFFSSNLSRLVRFVCNILFYAILQQLSALKKCLPFIYFPYLFFY